MFSYDFYKVLHLAMIFIYLATLGISFSGASVTKPVKILSGISGFLILVAGMGLLARMGQDHGAGFPGWVKVKLVIWAILAIGGPIAVKRMKPLRNIALSVFVGLAIVAAYVAINKPF